ncbi:uncharacterized protein LOC126693160 isoform X1 [Quercus robur]|uniref:uncharacterized protein LOC126693160 isoform X1 n=1 Tax=Quercus robur TaxID=38942 RepID=UPI002161EFDB|nr:uncharacterized protein LOC126693160 isoform X1 [Quercus robur]
MVEDTTLYQQLHKLSGIKSEEALHHLLSTLWNSRRTGLRPSEKSHLHSLLNLPSLPELDPLLACLRSLIRKCAHDNVTGDELLKLFPPDLPIDLQTTLVLSFQKFHNQWKQDLSTQQDPLPRNNSVSYQVRTSVPPSFACLPSSEISTTSTVTSLWPRQDDPVARLNRDDLGALAPLVVDTNASATLLDNLGTLPRLKSMTWTMQNCSSAPANRIAVISLKLQDFSKSPLGEMEVKFQLTRDTLEAMLRSMTYISEQLSNMASDNLTPQSHAESPSVAASTHRRSPRSSVGQTPKTHKHRSTQILAHPSLITDPPLRSPAMHGRAPILTTDPGHHHRSSIWPRFSHTESQAVPQKARTSHMQGNRFSRRRSIHLDPRFPSISHPFFLLSLSL